MSTLAAHAAFALLLGLGMRVRPKLLPLVPVIGLLPDVDHLDMLWEVPLLQSRVTFHNVFFAVALPLAVYVLLVVLEAREDWQGLAGKSPVLLTSAVVTDILSIEPAPGNNLGSVALFYPLDRRWWTVPHREAATLDPLAWGTLSAVLLVFTVLAVAAWAWFAYVAGPGNAPTHRARWLRVGIYVLAWVLLFVILVGAGLLVPTDPPPGQPPI